MSGVVLFWLFVSLLAMITAGIVLFYKKPEPCSFKIYAPYLTCWRWYIAKERPYTQKIFKIALQLDITNVSGARCMIRDLELFVIARGEKFSLSLLENGLPMKAFELKGRSLVQKNLYVSFDSIDNLPPFFANEEFHFYLAYRENRNKPESSKIHKINYIISLPEKA